MADKFDKFTERARRVLTLAQEEARRLGHNYIGTEHLLLGLVREGEGSAAGVLESLGISLEKVRARVIQAGSVTGWQGGRMSPRHPLGAHLRSVPANLHGQRETLAIEVVVALAEIAIFEGGFVAHLTIRVIGPWSDVPMFAARADDDQGRRYEGVAHGSSGHNIEGGLAWRSEYHFTPDPGTDARSLTLTFAAMRRRLGGSVVDDPAATWTFAVALPDAETALP